MLLGIGYLPQRTGPRLWQNFDAAEIRHDLTHIAELGFQAVRVPLFWGDFQPGEERINPRALDRFGQFLDMCHEAGLRVSAGLWAGMWDGALWWPEWGILPAPLPPGWPLIVNDSWMRWGRVRAPFTDERMLSSRDVLQRELVQFYAAHPALLGWEPLPGFGRLAAAADRSAALDWVRSALDALAPSQKPSTFLLALDALETAQPLWPSDILSAGGLPSLSIATFASDQRRVPLSAPWIAYALDLAGTLAQQPIALHLAGLPTAPQGEPGAAEDGVYYANEEEAAAHLADVIAIARDRQCPELWLWRWCDIPEPMWKLPPYDQATWRLRTGLLRGDGSEKQVIAGLKTESTIHLPRLEFDPDEYRSNPAQQFMHLWRRYSVEASS